MDQLGEIKKQIKDNNIKKTKDLIEELYFKYRDKNDEVELILYNIIDYTLDELHLFEYYPIILTKKYKILKFLLKKIVNIPEFNKQCSHQVYGICLRLSVIAEKQLKISEEKMFEILELLLSYDIDCKTIGNANRTPLHYLFIYGFSEITIKAAKILIEKGVDVNQKDISGTTALEYAMNTSQYRDLNKNNIDILLKITDLMIENGFNIKNIIKTTPNSIFSLWAYVFDYQCEKKLAKKDGEITKLKKEIEELRYKPGNPGYLEAIEDFEILKEKKN